MKKEFQSISDLNLEEPLYRLTLRPTISLFIMAAIGVISFVAAVWNFNINWLLLFFSFYFLGMVSFSVLVVKNRIVADLYDDFILIYSRDEQSTAVLIYFSEIESWKYQTGVATGDTLLITLQDHQSFTLESFKGNKIIKHFYKRIPEKEQRRKIFDVLKDK